MSAAPGRDRLTDIRLDETSLARTTPEADQERRIAIFDLLEENSFQLVGVDAGPYGLLLSVEDQRRLVFDVRTGAGEPARLVILALSPLARIVKDYFMICDSYHAAIRTQTPAQIEAIDMARRGLHNEAAELLRERLDGKIIVSQDTARRLFTLICALHVRP